MVDSTTVLQEDGFASSWGEGGAVVASNVVGWDTLAGLLGVEDASIEDDAGIGFEDETAAGAVGEKNEVPGYGSTVAGSYYTLRHQDYVAVRA